MLALAWGAAEIGGRDGNEEMQTVPQGYGAQESELRGLPMPPLWPTPEQALDATPTPSPAALATPTAPRPTDAPEPDIPEPRAPDAPPELAPTSARQAFLDGYRAGGGDPAWEEHLIDVLQCESEWVLDPPGVHLGLAQFSEDTWEKAKCSPGADYRDAWEQGCAVARWMAMIAGRWGTTVGWPHCWNVW